MFCWNGHGCTPGEFIPAKVPVYGEFNVGFSQTFANLLLPTLPEDHGVVIINTGVGGTGFSDGRWVVPNGSLTIQSIAAVEKLAIALPQNLGGEYIFHAMLWHQGEEDAGDNRDHFQATYCTYLMSDLSALIDHFRANFRGASTGTPFLDGGMLPYWVGLELKSAELTTISVAFYRFHPEEIMRTNVSFDDCQVFPAQLIFKMIAKVIWLFDDISSLKSNIPAVTFSQNVRCVLG